MHSIFILCDVVKVLPDAEFDRLHAAILANGRMEAGDSGCAESGPNFWYAGHHWGKRVHANATHKEYGIMVNHPRRPSTVLCRQQDLKACMAQALESYQMAVGYNESLRHDL